MSVSDIAQKISSMQIRGALKIAVEASRAIEAEIMDGADFERLVVCSDILRDARPTAVSLPNAINYILHLAKMHEESDPGLARSLLLADVSDFISHLEQSLDKLASIGANLVQDGDVILTICNSSTVAEVLKKAHMQGRRFSVYACETRPRLQGHITVKDLVKAGIDTTIIVDSAAHYTMRQKGVTKVMVGADTVYANGDVINKIGTGQVALVAKNVGLDIIVCTQTIKFSPYSAQGGLVDIEERDPKEVADIKGVKVFNPAFDITSKEYIGMIVTEDGIIPPEASYHVLKEKFGWSLG